MAYTVSGIAKMLGISASAVRYYDRNGLLPSVGRTSGGVRIFSEEDAESVRRVIELRRFGFSVRDIAELVQLPDGSERKREIIKSRAEEIRGEIERLGASLAAMEKWIEE